MISENDKDDFRVVFIVFAAVNRSKIDSHFRIRVYDNKTQVELLRIKNKYLKKLRDNGYLGYSREGDKYWYTQDDVDKFLRCSHYDAFATDSMLP